jgi:hypothetical protein
LVWGGGGGAGRPPPPPPRAGAFRVELAHGMSNTSPLRMKIRDEKNGMKEGREKKG